MKKFIIGTIAAIALLLAGIGIAHASIPAPDGTINGCYKNTTGDVKVVDSAASCPSGYTALNWNQMGPQGPPGMPSFYTVVDSRSVVGPFDGTVSSTSTCNSGDVALSAGYDIVQDAMQVIDLEPVDQSRWGWTLAIVTTGAGLGWDISLVCADTTA